MPNALLTAECTVPSCSFHQRLIDNVALFLWGLSVGKNEEKNFIVEKGVTNNTFKNHSIPSYGIYDLSDLSY